MPGTRADQDKGILANTGDTEKLSWMGKHLGQSCALSTHIQGSHNNQCLWSQKASWSYHLIKTWTFQYLIYLQEKPKTKQPAAHTTLAGKCYDKLWKAASKKKNAKWEKNIKIIFFLFTSNWKENQSIYAMLNPQLLLYIIILRTQTKINIWEAGVHKKALFLSKAAEASCSTTHTLQSLIQLQMWISERTYCTVFTAQQCNLKMEEFIWEN